MCSDAEGISGRGKRIISQSLDLGVSQYPTTTFALKVEMACISFFLFVFIILCIFLFCENYLFYCLLFIYLAAPGLDCGRQELPSLLRYARYFSCGMRTLSCGMWDLVL